MTTDHDYRGPMEQFTESASELVSPEVLLKLLPLVRRYARGLVADDDEARRRGA